jgi:hypothetical protein
MLEIKNEKVSRVLMIGIEMKSIEMKSIEMKKPRRSGA